LPGALTRSSRREQAKVTIAAANTSSSRPSSLGMYNAVKLTASRAAFRSDVRGKE